MDWQEPIGFPLDASKDRLIGDWHIYQRKAGHRTSTDDLITAWYAVHRQPKAPHRYLDLGCGVGSVMLMVCHKLRPAFAQGVEAQAQSYLMAERSLAELPEHSGQYQVQEGDFREVSLRGDYDLVTGSPPYFPLHTGVLPADAQRRACRFEARGGVEVYMEAAARAMSEKARFYLVFPARDVARVLAAAAKQELFLTGQSNFWMRRDRPDPFLSVFEFARQPCGFVHHLSCPVREADGNISEQYQQLRAELGLLQFPL